ncbi:hypothetical protein ABLE68_06640 [Nocardioides sp. CN2-186]|uniref:hypothetical protein n=1 Tax=Nocardioides tweenelious TaxID=3156607 RepID=UPI0032B5FA43
MSADIADVRGGVAGVAATYDAVRALADTCDAAGSVLRGWAGLGARVMADPDLVASAILSPLTFAEAEHAVVAATTGPDGLLPESLGWEADAALVRCAVDRLQLADALVSATVGSLDREVCLAVVPAALGIAAVLGPDALEDQVVAHPGLVQHAVHGAGAGTTGALLALAYGDDGTPRTTARPDLVVPSGGEQPHDLTGLIDHLHQVALFSQGPDSPDNGTIEIQSYDAGTDGARHVVYLPGTDDLATLPWTKDDDIRDLPTDLRSDAGLPTGYQQGILDAMHQAGIGPHEPVLLVGHSLGGMDAAALASHAHGFDITNVVTAGSPTAQVHGFPEGTHVLSLEHQGDIVPTLDGAPNPDTVGQVTVTFEDGGTSIVDHHDYGHYLAGAAAVDASTDPSVVEQLDSLSTHGFLATDGRPPSVTSHVFQVVRAR